MKQQIVLKGTQVGVGYRNGRQTVTVHEGLDFALQAGELTCLLGCNGAGKSTLLRTLVAAQPLLSGSLELMGRPLEEYSERERSRLIGVVFTDRTQAGGLTVYELVGLGRQPYTGFFGRLGKRDKQLIMQALEAVGMAGKARCYAAELSDGERQKVMIAKALVQECPLIVLDEPTAFLDAVSRMDIMALLHRLAVEEHKAVLLSTHDIEQALVLADRLWLMTGRGLTCGVTEDVVLSGGMDRLFAHNTIRFDLMHGGYSPVVSGRNSVRLRTDDEVLRHWAQNALNRHGYLCLSEDMAADVPLLEVVSATDIRWNASGGMRRFDSFGALLSALL